MGQGHVPWSVPLVSTVDSKGERQIMYSTMAEIRQANKDSGGHWFSPGAMRFFKSRIESRTPIDGRYFVTSETPGDGARRRFTVREISADGDVATADGCSFREHGTKREADSCAWALANARTD